MGRKLGQYVDPTQFPNLSLGRFTIRYASRLMADWNTYVKFGENTYESAGRSCNARLAQGPSPPATRRR